MIFSPWKKELETGIETIDDQHKKLYKTANDFGLKDIKNLTREPVLEFLLAFEELANDHFVYEENMMIRNNYPLSEYHRKLHFGFERTLEELKVRVKADTDMEDVCKKIFEASASWFSNHIENDDFAFATFCDTENLMTDTNFLNCTMEIIHKNNNLLGTGVIASISPEGMTVKNKGHSSVPVRINDVVKLNVFNAKLGFRVWEGRIVYGDINEIRMINVRVITAGNKRSFFRVKTNIKARLEVKNEERSEAFLEPMNIEVVVQDISLGGLLFASDQTFETGDSVLVTLELSGTETTLECFVVRIKRNEEVGKYGCKFSNYSAWQGNMLAKFVVDHQRAMAQRGR